MSVQTEIDRISENVAATYTAAEELGADLPEEQNSDNLAETIRAIPTAEIVQETGSSETAVMSQAAVTAELEKQSEEIADLTVPQAVVDGASAIVNKALSRGTGNVLRFVTWADAHQNNENELITKGNRELGQAIGEILKLMYVDFVSNLGDSAWGAYANTTEEVREQLKQFNRFVSPYTKDELELDCEGNHDDANYSMIDNDGDGTTASTYKLTPSEIYSLLYAKNRDVVFDTEHYLDGYCYKDFENIKTRVICLNTEQGTGDGGVVEGYQLKWFAETALNMTGKTDWNVVTLAHHPLDWGMATLFKDCVNIVDAFINGSNFSYTTQDGIAISIDYSNKNCQYVGHFHGHTHAFCIVKMQKYVSGNYVDINAWQIGIPNACYSRNNHNKGNANARIARFSTEITYNKSDVDGQRTSFNLITVDLDNKIIYADNFGVGIDRMVSYAEDIVTYSITRNLTNCTSSSGVSEVIEGGNHTETITASIGYTMEGATVMVTMNGVNVTSSVYSNGTINLTNITGNIVITVSAVEVPVASYTNQLPISIDTDGSIYNGTGYKANTYINSSGAVATKTGQTTTGFMPIPEPNSYALGQVVLYLANCELDNTTNTRVGFYDENKTLLSGLNYGSQFVTEETTNTNDKIATWDSNGYLVSLDVSKLCNYYKVASAISKVAKFVRFSGVGIDSETIITVNEPIE